MFYISFVMCFNALLSVQKVVNQVYWDVFEKPITFGSNVNLVCNVSCCQQDKKSVVTWEVTKNNKTNTVVFNGKSTNMSKYDAFSSEQKCILVVKQFEPDDGDINYTCTHNFDRFSKKLTINEAEFQLQPNNDTMTVSDEWIGDSTYSLSVKLTGVYPRPKCYVMYIDQNLTSNVVSNLIRDGIFYSVSLHIIHILNENGRFVMKCDIGNIPHTIKDLLIRIIYKEHESSFGIIITVTAVCTCIMISIVCIIQKKYNVIKKVQGLLVVMAFVIYEVTPWAKRRRSRESESDIPLLPMT